MNIIHEVMKMIINEINENMEEFINNGGDISTFILSFEKTMNQVGAKLVGEFIEIVDEAIRESEDRKQNWVIKEKDVEKTLETVFGQVKYVRTYYQNKDTNEYCFLLDKLMGIEVHDRMDTYMKSKLVEDSIYMSYGKSGKNVSSETELTSQTVMNAIRELGPVDNQAVEIKSSNERVRVLYVEADEDHVALQSKGKAEPKLVYVHEGKKMISKDRFELINPRYFSGMYSESDALWLEVINYIDKRYDIDSIEKIFISGDGASWIKNGVGWIKGSCYVLDHYHLTKYVTQATAHIKGIGSYMWKYLNNCDKEGLKALYSYIMSVTESEDKRKSVIKARTYMLLNWHGIVKRQDPDYQGCSTEGHISHILSSRLSSRPLGWCRVGVDEMSRLRSFSANGGNVYDLMMERKKRARKEEKRIQIDSEIARKRKLKASPETMGNLAILEKGKRTVAYRFLSSIRDT